MVTALRSQAHYLHVVGAVSNEITASLNACVNVQLVTLRVQPGEALPLSGISRQNSCGIILGIIMHNPSYS